MRGKRQFLRKKEIRLNQTQQMLYTVTTHHQQRNELHSCLKCCDILKLENLDHCLQTMVCLNTQLLLPFGFSWI